MASPALGRSLNSIQYVADVPYYISNADIKSGLENDSITGPCTVIPYMDPTTTDYVRDIIAAFSSEDDVWSSGFLDTVVFDRSPSNAQPAEDVLNLREHGTRNVSFRREFVGGQQLSWGPYWLENKLLHKVSRLYSDDVDAFVMSTVPSEGDPFE